MKNRWFYIFMIVMSALATTHSVNADDFIQWHQSNIQMLRGKQYEAGEKQRTILTVEHANKWTYGDFFGFVDITYPDSEKSSYYAELSPRFSLGKITKKNFSFGPIKDVLVSTTFEKPKGRGPHYLYGLAADLNIPTFRFATINAYIRDDTQLSGSTWQTTLAWNKPFKIGNIPFVTEGFADFAGDEGTSESNQLIVPRLLVDVGSLSNIKENKFFVGMEYQYWHNKFGIDGLTESVPQIQAKWIF